MTHKRQENENKPPIKRKGFFSFVKAVLRLFYKKPKIIYSGGEIVQPSIIVSNHVSLKGPVMHELYLPVLHAKWGAGEMLGNYKMRFNYLRNVFYMRKRGFGKAKSTFLAAFSALFSRPFYKGMNIIPTWHDSRMFTTVTRSIDILKGGASVLIFPENSDEGYKDVLTQFHAGFVTLAEGYYKRTNTDLPVYPVYYHKKKRIIMVGKPLFVQDFVKQGLDRKQIAEQFRNTVNGLYEQIR